jgi:hypothetical protein
MDTVTVYSNKARLSFWEKLKEFWFKNLDMVVPGVIAMNGGYYRPVD